MKIPFDVKTKSFNKSKVEDLLKNVRNYQFGKIKTISWKYKFEVERVFLLRLIQNYISLSNTWCIIKTSYFQFRCSLEPIELQLYTTLLLVFFHSCKQSHLFAIIFWNDFKDSTEIFLC